MLPIAGVVALVVVTQSAATTRAFADQGGYEVDVGRDFLGVGAGSIAAGLVGAFPVNASPPRTAAVAAASGRTQAAGLGAAAAILLLVPAAGLLKDVPVATLAGVLLFVAARLFHGRDLLAIARFDPFEFALAVTTMLTVALLGVEQGIAVAVGLAILDRTRLSARPQMHVLGRIPQTTSWAPISSPSEPAQVPGVLVVLFATPLWYANAIHFHDQLQIALTRASGAPRLVVLDAVGMSDLDYTGARSLRDGARRTRPQAHLVRHRQSRRARTRQPDPKRPAPAHRRGPALPLGQRSRHRAPLRKPRLARRCIRRLTPAPVRPMRGAV